MPLLFLFYKPISPTCRVTRALYGVTRLTQKEGIALGKGMVVRPLAAESIGVRSLSTFVRTPDLRVLIDPGAALGTRKRLHPHPKEYKILAERRASIQTTAEESDCIVISHYHFDHLLPFFKNYAYFWSSKEEAAALYHQRRIMCKDPSHNINRNQRRRGTAFVRGVREVAREVLYADSQVLKIGATTIQFSPAVPHGREGTHLGFVVMTAIQHQGISVVHASDVQGPMVSETTNWILQRKPQLLILAGPPTYLSPERVSPSLITKAANNLRRLVAQIPIIILDHHLQRDSNWREWAAPIQEMSRDIGHRLITVAEAIGLPEQLLETQRSELYNTEHPSPTYEAWVKSIDRGLTRVQPPL